MSTCLPQWSEAFLWSARWVGGQDTSFPESLGLPLPPTFRGYASWELQEEATVD